MELDFREHTFMSEHVRLNFAEGRAAGVPLVFLHGGSARWQSFSGIMPAFVESYHLYAPDLRGHGLSERTPGSYRLQNFADDLIDFLQQVVRDPAIVLGHSLGGMIALMGAAQYPQGVRAVVAEDAPLSRESWHTMLLSSQAHVSAWRNLSGGQVPLEQVIQSLKETPVEASGNDTPITMRDLMGDEWQGWSAFATELYQNDPDFVDALMDHFETTASGYDMAGILPAIRCPVLLLQADSRAGGAMTNADVQQALSLLCKPKHLRFEGVSHGMHFERPAEFIQAVQSFLQSQGTL